MFSKRYVLGTSVSLSEYKSPFQPTEIEPLGLKSTFKTSIKRFLHSGKFENPLLDHGAFSVFFQGTWMLAFWKSPNSNWRTDGDVQNWVYEKIICGHLETFLYVLI
jgi:hypothetical protein